nr:putative receptor protein kinase zmpk1 [Quercus suber]
MKNRTDWSYGCELEFDLLPRNKNESVFILLSHVEFYGYDFGSFPSYTLDQCTDLCLQLRNCEGFQYYGFDNGKGSTSCYPKTLLLNGHRSPDFKGLAYLRLPKRKSSGVEEQGYALAATRFRKFTYSELQKATKGFTKEIERGAWGAVYKGVLFDKRVAAIKCVNEANQGEDVFLAEVSIIGRLNHMNLIDTWGYCAEGKRKLLVYEYMKHGSLAENLSFNALD